MSSGCRGHPLALTYNDCSPNENHHVSSAFALLRRPENNFLRRLSKKNLVRHGFAFIYATIRTLGNHIAQLPSSAAACSALPVQFGLHEKQLLNSETCSAMPAPPLALGTCTCLELEMARTAM